MNELISIIIPVYNSEEYLPKCIESVLNQTYSNLEIIIINDGSTDDSGKICDDYALKDNRITVIHKENGGVSSARNKGIEKATGKYIGFIDADDYIEIDMFEKLYENIKHDDYDISICNYNIILGTNKIPNNISKECKKIFNNKEYLSGLFDKNLYCGYLVNKLIKTECIKNVRFDENVSVLEDLLFLTEIHENISKVYFDKDVFLYNYVQRENSATNNFNKKKYMSMIMALEKIISYIDDNNTKNGVIFDYLQYVMIYYSYCYNTDKNEFNNIKKKSLKIRKKCFRKAMKTNFYGIKRKLKLFIISYFPIIYGKMNYFKNRNLYN